MNKIYNIHVINIIVVVYIMTILLGPIFRLPFIEHRHIEAVKIVILFFWLVILIGFFSCNKAGRLKKTIFHYYKELVYSLLFMLCYILMTYFYSTHSNTLSLKGSHFNVLLYSVILICMVVVTTVLLLNTKNNFYKLISLPAYIVSALCLSHVVAVYFSVDSYILDNFKAAGYSMELKTNWSNSISLFAIIVPVYISTTTNSSIKIFLSFIYGSFPILASQLISEGRAGLIASLFSVLAWMFFILPKKYIYIYLAICILFTIMVADFTPIIIKSLSYISFDPSDWNYEFFNKLSSQRLAHWVFAFGLIEKHPLLGVGLGNAVIDVPPNIGHSIHNIFFRRAAELGTPFLVVMLFQLSYVYYRVKLISPLLKYSYKIRFKNSNPKLYRNEVIYIKSSLIIIVSSVFIAFFEPSYIWGGVGQSWLTWISVSILLFYSKKIWRLHFLEQNYSYPR